MKDLDVQAQFDTLIKADLKCILMDFKEVLRSPTLEDVDVLIDRYASSSPKQKDDLLILLSINSTHFSDKAWSWLMDFAQADNIFRWLAFKTLNRADAVRFGRILLDCDWSWNSEEHYLVNHFGSSALIKATLEQPFDQIAPRLAPWRLFEAVGLRGADPAEVRLATEIFGHVLAAEKIEQPDPGSILSVDRAEEADGPFKFSVSPHPDREDYSDPFAAIKASMDVDEQIKTRRRAAETAVSRIDEARKSGASLYLVHINAKDFEPVLQHASEIVANWLEELDELTTDFRRRVDLAESAFLALCETLFTFDPDWGARLWRALRATVTTRYKGAADIDDLLHIVFRVPDSSAVTVLQDELIELASCHTDQALFDIAIAASYNGKADWLSIVIEKDRASSLIWKRKRGKILAGFTANNSLPIEAAWPDGEIRTGYADLERKAAHFRWFEACSCHWWRIYLSSQDRAEAYAAWVLFLRSADSRAWIWMREDSQAAKDASSFFNFKLSHAWLNRSDLKSAMKKRADKLDEIFLDRKIVLGVGPWGKEIS